MKLKFVPNLTDYHQKKAAFSYSRAEQELGWETQVKINLAHTVISRQAYGQNSLKTALDWLGADGRRIKWTFAELERRSNQWANFLIRQDVNPGDRVFLFLPKIPELYAAFLGIIKTGAIAGTLFPAFADQALLERLKNSQAKMVITDSELQSRFISIREQLTDLEKITVVDDGLIKNLDKEHEDFSPFLVEPDAPAYMLYTSATGNTPVCGIVTAHKALSQQCLTAKWALDLKANDIYWCTADPGWVTGVVYGILAPWALGITQVVYAGRFEPSVWYKFLADMKVTVWYSAPTAFRMLEAADLNNSQFDFSRLRHICSVGEALEPKSIAWAKKVFGLPIYDTWWQTEIGAIMIANLPALPIKPGSMGVVMPGLEAAVLSDSFQIMKNGEEGTLAFKKGWPAMMQAVWQNDRRFQSYFSGNWYLSGDKVTQDDDGYFWFIGRADDVIKTSGERVGPFEVESALREHAAIVEAAVIGKPDALRGQIIKAFIILKTGLSGTDKLKQEIQQFVKTKLAGHAYPREIEFVTELPKNRSGKILRRVLKEQDTAINKIV